MRSSALIVLFVMLPAACAGGQQSSTPSHRILVYAPAKDLVQPRLLPPAAPLTRQNNCKYNWKGKVVLALLVDTEGMPRNIIFQQPSGSVLDQLALNIARDDRFQPGTLNGKPVVVAESLELKIETCIKTSKDAAGKIGARFMLSSEPRQKLKKPKNPPQEVVFTPLQEPASEIARKIARPEYFGAAKSAPVLLYAAPARYTPPRDGPEINGVCKISLLVDAHGMPQNPRVLKSLTPAADRSALEAVGFYRFFPAILDEEPVPAAIVVNVAFAPPGPDDYNEDD